MARAKKRSKRSNPLLTELGKLTELRWQGGSKRWSLATAPSLAYDDSGRLLIVYGMSILGDATDVERREYKRTHWGEAGLGTLEQGDVAKPPWRELGRGTSITYTTRKGSRELVDWVHEWGEGARGRWIAPTVVEHACGAPTCAGRAKFALRGGTYRVTERGIVG